MLVVKSTLSQRIKALMIQDTFWRNALPIDAVNSILNVSAVIKRAYDPNVIPQDIWRTRINTITWNRRVSNDKTAISDWISQTTVAPTADITWWTTNIVRSATDYNTVARAAWTIKLADWTAYSISAWNTWNMSAITYIYLDRNVSTTVLQQSTNYLTAVWAGKIMVCVAKNSTSPTLAQFQAFWTLWNGVFITADNIAANTITANQIAANTITATQISSSYVYAWTINADNITSWTITGRTLQTSSTWKRVIIDWTENSIVFYDASAWDVWHMEGSYNAVLWSGIISVTESFMVNWAMIFWWGTIWTLYSYLDWTYDLWTNTAWWRNIYMTWSIDFDNWDWVLSEVNWYPRWSANWWTARWIPFVDGTSTTKTTTSSLLLNIWWVQYYVNVLPV